MKKSLALMITAGMLASCSVNKETKSEDDFNFTVENFADVQILRYRVNGFDQLSLQQKTLIYHLSQAAAEGRDILFDQNGKYNLAIRRVLEAIYTQSKSDKNTQEFKNLEEYLKLVWFNNGIHNDYSSDKLVPKFSADYFVNEVKALDSSLVPTREGATVDQFLAEITPVIFDPAVMAIRANQAKGQDLCLTSANNYYDGVSQAEAEAFYDAMKDPKDNTPISYGLNTRLVKENGKVFEKVWKVGGLYTAAIEKVVDHLTTALNYTENEKQKAVIESLISYYRTGSLKEFDDYSVLWVKDVDSQVDFVNGFIENYGDPLGLKSSWESVVNFKNIEATKRTELISNNAQWFEDRSPVDSRFKKEEVKGVSAKVITVAMLGGDTYPTSPLGINLPNATWIRRDHGSKSVTIENISEAYDKSAQGNGFGEEFVWSQQERDLLKNYGFQASNLHTDLHECLGHGSGKLLSGTDPDALKAYGSPLEEMRADLYALYFMADAKTVELGLLPNEEAYKAEYYKYVMNGLMTQLTRVQLGKSIEQAHMRCRSSISHWVLANGAADNVVELKKRDGKTYVVVNDYVKMRELLGKLLSEIQRIKSEGDYQAGMNMIETYGVNVNRELHEEVLTRYAALNIAPWRGFLNPVFNAAVDAKGEITNVTLTYNEGYAEQMLRYSNENSPLPTYNN
ncbi:MAG: dipeptidyl-peptidase 3 family protein [Bacteroidales bacterium]